LAFDDGVSGVVDLSELVGRGVFALWDDRQVFEQVRIGSFGELVWDDQKAFQKKKMRFAVVGGLAMTFYDEPRFTRDIDIRKLKK